MKRSLYPEYQAMLEQEARRLEMRVDGLEETTPPHDTGDTANGSTNKELAGILSTRNFQLASLVRSALDRIRDDEFGECLECGQQIGENRLAAMPWAPLCLACQQEVEDGLKPELAHLVVGLRNQGTPVTRKNRRRPRLAAVCA